MIVFRRYAAVLFFALCHYAPTLAQEGAALQMLEQKTPVERELSGGEPHVYAIRLNAGLFFEACVDRLGMAVDVAVFSPTGQKVAQGDGVWAKNGCDMVSYVATTEGDYRIEVRPLFPTTAGGRYRMRLISVRSPTEADLHRVQGNRAFASAHRRRFHWNEEAPQALAEFQEAVKHWQAAGDKVREAMTYSAIATVHRSLGELPKATEYFEKALAIFRAESHHLQEIETMADLSYTYAKQGQVLRGFTFAKEALNLSRACGDQYGQCRALLMLGGITNAAGNVRTGQKYSREALPLCRAAAIPFAERIALTQIADTFVYLGEPQQALNFFNQALQIHDPAFDAHAQGYIRLNLARLRLQTGELQESLTQAQRALESFRRVGTRDWQAHSRLVLGRIYQALGDDEQAYHSFNQAFGLSVAAGDPNLKALSLCDLASVSIRAGRRAEAENYLEHAAEAFHEKGTPSSEVEAFKQLGQLELLRDRPAVAIDYFKQALALCQRQELVARETETLWTLGTAYLALGEREGAAESFLRALTRAREKHLPDYEIQALGGLARLALKRGDDHQAQTLLEPALNLLETSRARIASPDFRVSFFSTTQSFYEAYIEALMNQHERERERGNFRFAELALQAVERARARSLLDLLAEAHADIRQGIDPALLDRERELQQRLSAKAERLWLLGQSGNNGEQAAAIQTEMDAITLEQRDLAAQIRVHSPRYAALQQPQPLTLPEIQKQVLDSDTLLLEYALGERRSFLFAVTTTEIQSFVLPGRNEIELEARRMLRLLEASGRAQVFKSITAKRRRERKLQLLEAPGRAPVFESIAAKRRWEGQLQKEYLKTATVMSGILLAPVGEMLRHKRLLIVSDGVLHYLPFAALPEPTAHGHNHNAQPAGSGRRVRAVGNRQPLVVKHEIVMIPSASTLAVLRQELNGREIAPKIVAVLADPVFDNVDERLAGRSNVEAQGATGNKRSASIRSSDASGEINERLFRLADADPDQKLVIPRLPGSRREAEAILSLVPESQRRAAFDFDASRITATSPELGKYRYLHFATHGLINSEHPELSGLVLSLVDREGHRQPGILRAQDIYNLKLPVELVVLSACRTALGKESGGEGVMGLTRGFFYAGARRVVASLWTVSDAATAELMKRFYREMLGEKRLTPAAALRAAQVSMWKERRGSVPYYWAAFTLQGEW